MADDARTQFIDGLRVSAAHLQHLQDRLRESLLDVRTTLGLGTVAWGLRVTVGTTPPDTVRSPRASPSRGAAFAWRSTRRDSSSVPEGDDGTSLALVLRAEPGDQEALRFNGVPTVLTLGTHAELVDPDESLDGDAIAIADDRARGGRALRVAGVDAVRDRRDACAQRRLRAGQRRALALRRCGARGRWRWGPPVLRVLRVLLGRQGRGLGADGAAGPAGPPGEPGADGADGPPGP